MLIIYGYLKMRERLLYFYLDFSSYFENCRVLINSTFFNTDLLAYLTLKVTKIGFRYCNVAILNGKNRKKNQFVYKQIIQILHDL